MIVEERLGATYTLLDSIPAARADLPLLLSMRVQNDGAAAWPHAGPNPIHLSYHWLDAQGQMFDFEGVRAALPAPLAAQAAAELELHVEPPSAPGSYILAIDMVEEGVGWFSQRGVPPLTVPISVAPGPVGAPRACIVSSLCLPNDAVGNHIIEQMRFLQERGYQVLIVIEDVDRRHPRELRQYMAALSYGDLKRETPTPDTRRALEFFRSADIYLYHYAIHYTFFPSIAEIERGVVLIDYHGVTPPHLWDRSSDGYPGLVEAQRQIRLARYADYGIVHSGYTHEELVRLAGLAPERVAIVPLIAPVERFRPAPRRADIIARYQLGDGPVLLYVGRIAANKRIVDLVAALPAIHARYPGTTLLVVGDDSSPPHAPVAAQVRRLVADLGLERSVILTGMVPDDELPAHYHVADLFVTASLHEGFCIPVIEAMGCGLPVVGTHTTALPETIGGAGVTFEPKDIAGLARKVIEILDSRMADQHADRQLAGGGQPA